MTSNELGVAILACGLLVSGFLWVVLKMTDGGLCDDEMEDAHGDVPEVPHE